MEKLQETPRVQKSETGQFRVSLLFDLFDHLKLKTRENFLNKSCRGHIEIVVYQISESNSKDNYFKTYTKYRTETVLLKI